MNPTCCLKAVYHYSLRGGGGYPDLFVKLDFEITVGQQTRAHDRTFEGFRTPGAHRTATPIFVQFLAQ